MAEDVDTASGYSVMPLQGVPEIEPGDQLLDHIGTALSSSSIQLEDGDILCIAHKAVSKAEGSVQSLSEVKVSDRARELAAKLDKDPQVVEVVLSQSREVVRAEHGVLICRTYHGFVCANAGVDSSNSGDSDRVILLPKDPDRSARKLRQQLSEKYGVKVGVVITDSFGRAWRVGQVDTAIGIAGVKPLADLRGNNDRDGRELQASMPAVADQLAAAADLARSKSSGTPFVLVRGLSSLLMVKEEQSAATTSLVRPASEDLFT